MNANTIPAGFVLVPREITPDMIEAWVEAETFEDGYRAMIAAAPSTADLVAHETPNASDNGICVQPASGEVVLDKDDRDFLMFILKNPCTKFDTYEWPEDGREQRWTRFEREGLIECVGSWKWKPLDEAKLIQRLAATPASPQAPAPQAVVGEASTSGPPHRGLKRELQTFTEGIRFAERAHGIHPTEGERSHD